MSTTTSPTTPSRRPVSRVITWVPISSERSQSRSLGAGALGSGTAGVEEVKSGGPVGPLWPTPPAQAAGGKPTTWVWEPRAWVTPIVRPEAAIIGRR